MTGRAWTERMCRACLPLSRAAADPGAEKWLRDLAYRPGQAALLPRVRDAALTDWLAAQDWTDGELMWLLTTLRRHPAHRVIGVMMSLHEAACRELVDAALA